MAESINFTTPVGRLVEGSLYKANTTDAEGKPLVVKNGPNAGQPRPEYYFALAIPKAGEQHWAQTDWGAKVWEVGHKSFPNGQASSPAFAWKITDGDSQVPNRKGRKPCDREGFKGCWVLRWSSGYAPKIFNANGTQAITDPDAVKLGYYVQVNGSVAGNGSQQQPGVYLNHSMVALSAYGEEIVLGPDPTAAGFGNAALPPGASATPPAALPPAAPPVPVGPAVPPSAPLPPAAPPVPVGPAVPPSAPLPPVVATAPVAPPVVPNHAFVAGPVVQVPVPGAPPAPPAPPAAPAAPVRQMLPAANGATYEQLVAAGWTDALLVQYGMMAP